tara:strand:- start:1938 stop:3116 length:1179 start_codon:yes stop_codon:yes gene_type:complete
MAETKFNAQIVNLVGAFDDETALDSFITEGANEVINAMPRAIQERVSEETAVATGTTPSEGHKVLYMTRTDGSIDQPCRAISAGQRGRVSDSSDMAYATASDPAYYIKDGKFNILPSGAGVLISMPTYSQTVPLDASDLSTITNFPNEYEYLVTLYAAIKALQQNMATKSSSLPADINLPTIPSVISISTIEYTDASNEDALVDLIEVPAKIDVSSNAPNFTKPSVATSIGAVTSAITNEDIELATSGIQKIQSELATINANFANEQAEFNKESSIYQMEFQEEVTRVNQELQAEVEKFRARVSISQANKQQDQTLNLQNAIKQMEVIIANNSIKVQKFGADLQHYQALVSAQFQNFNLKLQKQTTDYQWFVNQRQQLQADYDKGIQIMRGT